MSLTIEELEARQAEIVGRLQEIDSEHAGRQMPEEARAEWNQLGEERDQNTVLLEELRQRHEFLRQASDDPSRREDGAGFNVQPQRPENIWDVAAVRAASRGPDDEIRMLRDNALRAVEGATFPHPLAGKDDVKGHIERTLARFAGPEEVGGSVSAIHEYTRRILTTGSPVYQRAFSKTLAGLALSADEQRALSTTGASGGYAVPYTLDPTIIPTSNSSVNPMRAISRVESIAGSNEWRGVSSGAISASRDAEGTEVSDDTPTLAQPTATVTKVSAFVPFSMEIGMDWGALQEEMARLLQDAKDDEEASATVSTSGFVTGDGTGQNPQGVVTGTTSTIAAGTAAFAVGHLYALVEALPPRFRPRGQFVGNLAQYHRIQQFDTSGGGLFWGDLRDGVQSSGVPAPGNTGRTLLSRPTWEASAMASVLTAGSKILIYGDFRYYLIVDRIGMDIEIVPHLFGASGRPTGQRGIYANWRNTGKVLSAAAFRALQTT